MTAACCCRAQDDSGVLLQGLRMTAGGVCAGSASQLFGMNFHEFSGIQIDFSTSKKKTPFKHQFIYILYIAT